MSYIGKSPAVGNFQVCDAISVVNGQASYTMQVDSVNVVPESANHMLVSLNGILQKSGSSFTVSSSTITFASNLVTGDVIDFIMILGNVLDLGVPSDATVTNAKTNFVSTSSSAGLQIKGDGTTDGTLQLNCSQNSHGIKLKSPPHSAGASYTLTFPNNDGDASQFLQTNGSGVMTWADAGGGITEADQYRLTADISSNANPITSNFERVDDPSFEKIGSGMSVSSGTWTFPSTGLYQVVTSLKGNSSNGSDSWGIYVNATTNNSSYDTIAQVFMGTTNTDQVSEMSSQINFINVTNTSNVKLQFEAGSISSGSYIEGDTNQNKTCFTFIRLGDSV